MSTESHHVSVQIDRPAAIVYDAIVDPARLPEWAAGLSGSIDEVDGRWIAESPMGRVEVAFVERNRFGMADHDVTLPSGETVTNHVRVLPDGTGSEVVFTVRRSPGASEAEHRRDVDAVTADLLTLKRLLEGDGALGRR